jgi:hypothetical protein
MSKRKRADGDSQDDLLPKRINAPEARSNNPFTLKQIENFLRKRDATRFNRAKGITDAVYNCTRTGNELRAKIHGSTGRYNIHIVFKEGVPIDNAFTRLSCSCPDGGSPCKHGGAVLLCFGLNPDKFQQRQSIREVVQVQEKETLTEMLVALANSNHGASNFIYSYLGIDTGADDDDDDDDYDDDRYDNFFE